MRRAWPVGVLVGTLCACGTGASASEPAAGPAPGRALTVGVGLGSGRMSVGTLAADTITPSLLARVGLDRANRVVLAAEAQPRGVQNPALGEALHATNLMLGYTLGGRLQVRPLVGVQFRLWSGSQRVEANDYGPALGLDVGYVVPLRVRLDLTPELCWRGSIVEVEGNVTSRYLGAQLALSWRPGGR